MNLKKILGVDLPIIQAPMAGVQDSALAIAVSNAGGLGSLPCAMLGMDTLREELRTIKAQTDRPYNVNFFCHEMPKTNQKAEMIWRNALSPFYKTQGIDPETVAVGTNRVPFNSDAVDVLEEFKPPVVSFHFGLPADELLVRVKSFGAKVMSTATTVEEALWLEEYGADIIIAQGLEAGGHRGMFLSDGFVCVVATNHSSGKCSCCRSRWDCECKGCCCGNIDGCSGGAAGNNLFTLSRSSYQ